MATIVAAAGGGNWTVGGTWVGGVAPTAADDAVLNATSGNVNINSGAVARSVDCTGYVGSITHLAAATLTLGDNGAGAGNNILKFVIGMGYSLGNARTSAIQFQSNNATPQTITTAGKTLGNVGFGGSGTHKLLDPMNTGAGTGANVTAVTITGGTLDTNNQNCSWGRFNSVSNNVRTVNLGTSTITITGNLTTIWDCSNANNLTMNAGSSTINIGVGNNSFLHGTVLDGPVAAYGTVTFGGPGDNTFGIGVNPTFVNLSVTASVGSKSDNFIIVTGTVNISSTLTLQGNNARERLQIATTATAQPGTARTINAALKSIQFVDFRDITAGGAAAPFTGTSLGDCQGNTNITFDTSVTQTFVGGTKSWSDITSWTSRVPLPQDDVIIATATGGTLTADMPRLGKSLTFTGYNGTFDPSTSVAFFGNLVLSSAMTYSSAQSLSFMGRGAQTINSAGITMPGTCVILAPGGTYTLLAPFTVTPSRTLTINRGTFAAGSNNVSAGQVTDSPIGPRTIDLGSAIWTLTGIGTTAVWSMNSAVNLTILFTTAVININPVTGSNIKFFGAGKSYPPVSMLATSGATLFLIGDNGNTFASLDIECTTARTLSIFAGSTQTVTGSRIFQGASGQLLSVVSSSPGTKATIVAPGNSPLPVFTSFSSDISQVGICGTVNETDSVFSVSKSRIYHTNTATEVDTAFVVTKRRVYTLGFPSESDSARTVTKQRSYHPGTALETDTASDAYRASGLDTKLVGIADTDTSLVAIADEYSTIEGR